MSLPDVAFTDSRPILQSHEDSFRMCLFQGEPTLLQSAARPAHCASGKPGAWSTALMIRSPLCMAACRTRSSSRCPPHILPFGAIGQQLVEPHQILRRLQLLRQWSMS